MRFVERSAFRTTKETPIRRGTGPGQKKKKTGDNRNENGRGTACILILKDSITFKPFSHYIKTYEC